MHLSFNPILILIHFSTSKNWMLPKCEMRESLPYTQIKLTLNNNLVVERGLQAAKTTTAVDLVVMATISNLIVIFLSFWELSLVEFTSWVWVDANVLQFVTFQTKYINTCIFTKHKHQRKKNQVERMPLRPLLMLSATTSIRKFHTQLR